MITVLFVPGTFEQPSTDGYPTGMLKKVADLLPSDRFECIAVSYPMQYGNPTPYEDSVNIGCGRTVAAIRATANPVIIIGYSQGAVIAARVAADIRDRRLLGLDVRMVVTIANPERAEREGVHNVPGSGVAEGRTLARCPFPVVQLALPDDVITSASQDSLVRDLADLSEYMSGDLVRWASSVLARLTVGRLQNVLAWRENFLWMLGRTPARVVTASREITGYLGRPPIGSVPAIPSVHTMYGHRIVPGTNVDNLTYAAQRIESL